MKSFLPATALALICACKAAAQIDVKTLSSDFILFNEHTFENTARVITPSGNSKGAIALICGEPRPGWIVYRPLLNSSNEFNVSGQPTVINMYVFKSNVDSGGTDNNIIHVTGNKLFFIKNGYTWANINPHPFWWNIIHTIKPEFPPGARNATSYFRSDDGRHWDFSGKVDIAKVDNGEFGVPQSTTIGGFDRTEVYQDPFTGRFFMSGHGDGGPQRDNQNKLHDIHKELILSSTDNAKTWQLEKQLDEGAPLVMTSTPNHRFFGFACTGKVPTIFYSTDPAKPGDINNGREVFFAINKKRDSADVDDKVPPAVFRAIQQISICRVSTDKQTSIVCAAYSTLNKFGRQEYRFVTIKVDDNAKPETQPTVYNLLALKSEDEKKNSIIYGTFIQPDFVDKDNFKEYNNAIVFYYVEVSTGPSPKAMAKYLVFGNSGYASSSMVLLREGYLSTKSDGSPRKWSDPASIGDYMSGGFFFYKNACHYLAQWEENDGSHANIITVTHRK